MRVAFMGIKGLPSRGGAERVVEAIATRLPAYGMTPVVYCDRRYTPPGTKIDGVEIVRIPSLPGKHARQFSLNMIAALHAVFLGHCDLVNVHHVEAAFIYPLLRLRYRVVGTCHGLAYWRAKWSPVVKFIMRMMDTPFARLSNLMTCVSARDSEYFRGRFGRECRFIRVGVNLGFEVKTEEARLVQAQHGLSPGEYMLFAAGRIDPTKGAHMAIEAQKRLNKPVPLLIVGDESHAPGHCAELHSAAAENTYFHPLIEDPGILLGVMADARCLVFPSFMEAMSSILLEAGSVGLPVLCSDIPENVAVMQDDAVYFESESVDSLAEKMQWAVNHRDEMSRMGERARTRIREQHNWDTIVGQYAEAFSSVCGKRPGSGEGGSIGGGASASG